MPTVRADCSGRGGAGEARSNIIQCSAIKHAPALIAAVKALEAALREIQPYFEGEHYYGHPHCVLIRAALAQLDKRIEK